MAEPSIVPGISDNQLPAPPAARAAAAAAAIKGGKVYVVGGRDEGGLVREMLILDLTSLRWSRAPGPVPREHLAATAAGGRVYVLGGRKAGFDTNVATAQSYDPRRSRWRTLRPLPSSRGGTGAAAIAGRIVSVGGEDPAGSIRSVYAYVRTGRWERLDDLPTPRHGLGVVAHSGRVYAIAGGPRPGLTVSGAVESLPVR
jgi:N-acetylneuraminic acid mutarotase